MEQNCTVAYWTRRAVATSLAAYKQYITDARVKGTIRMLHFFTDNNKHTVIQRSFYSAELQRWTWAPAIDCMTFCYPVTLGYRSLVRRGSSPNFPSSL